MHKNLEIIKKYEKQPKIIKNLYSENEIKKFINLYNELPITTHNKKQSVIKKRWLLNYSKELEELFCKRLKNEIGDFKMDNLKTDEGNEIYGLFQESYNPIGLHIDGGFNHEDQIYKQSLIPLTPVGSTVIFKNRFYGISTSFTKNEKELLENDPQNYKKGKNERSNQHLKMFSDKSFDVDNYEKYLKHEDIENLKGLEVEYVYKWKLGDLFIFDRTHLHCSSCNIKNKKIGLATFTKK